MLVDTVIRAGEANPNDVVLYIQPDASLAFPKTLQMGTIWLEMPTGDGGVYPTKGHVRTPDAYGPTGTEYVGIEVLPIEAEVKLDVGYGADGIEFTGSYSGGVFPIIGGNHIIHIEG